MSLASRLERITQGRERRVENRQAILELYGRRCSNCGYHRDERALQLDHVEGKPDPRYRSGAQLYAAILNGTIPDHLFQLLCANCNVIKKFSSPIESNLHVEIGMTARMQTETRNSETSLKLRPVSETNGFNDLQNGETDIVSSGRSAISVPTIISEITEFFSHFCTNRKKNDDFC